MADIEATPFKRTEMYVMLRDPEGEVHEVTVRNASDLVQLKGWKYATPDTQEEELARRAAAPRTKKSAAEAKRRTATKAAPESTVKSKAKAKVEVTLPIDEEVDDDDFSVENPVVSLDDDLDDIEPFDTAVSKAKAKGALAKTLKEVAEGN